MIAALVLASNRGPVSFGEDGSVRRGGGGLVSALNTTGAEATWVCAALSDADRRAARAGQAPEGVRMLDIDAVTFDRAYNAVANSTLWFVSHLLFDTASRPAFGQRSRREWEAYVAYDDAFAAALAEEAAPGAAVLVQDYHLSLTPRQLRERRPDLRIAHFSHTPWAPPEYFRMLPDAVAQDVLTGLLGADAVGFHSPRWADAFARCCVELLGASYENRCVTYDGRSTAVEVHPLGVDGAELRERGAQPDVEAKLPAVRELVGDRQLLLRIDRTELSKNIVRGLEAYRELLRRYPEHRERVVHLAFAYPSRHDLPEYREYTGAVQRVAREVNEEFARPGWVPVHLEVKDDYARSLAAMRLADVLVVNPLRDGMNLVAKEAPVLSERGVGLVLSREAGAADDLGADALLVNPYDVSQTADAMHTALTTDVRERAGRSERLATAATAFPPSRWLSDQLASL
ncbi:MAG: trehalose-6-phosphate synthase [Actinobacteria bacterium]|nr:trehalose-6-phosphate synthase [Actinomycetota bacterium]MCA1722316.1 trehalose-6-phosphate synthase [Actinomycetota bacterium]